MPVVESNGRLGGLKGIAALAGVSPATVSRVINNRPGVRAELRRAVEIAIQEHGLELNVAARALKTCRTRMLAIIIPRSGDFVFANPFFTEIFRGISVVVERAGYSLSLMTGATSQTLYEVNRNRSCDGVLFIGFRRNIPDPRSIKGATVPVVTIPQPGARYRLPFVTVDDEAGAHEATRYLIDRGHTRIALLCGAPTGVFSVNRLAGYRRALADGGLPESAEMVIDADYTFDGARHEAIRLLQMESPPTAFFATSDHMAMGALSAIRARGLRIPEDVALIGFGNSPVCDYVTPPLTTVDEQLHEMGHQAGKMLLALVQGEQPPESQIVLPTKLVVRESA